MTTAMESMIVPVLDNDTRFMREYNTYVDQLKKAVADFWANPDLQNGQEAPTPKGLNTKAFDQ